MIKRIHKFKSVVKDRLFYNRFEYCISFRLDEISCLRELSHENIDQFIKRRQIWREISQQRIANAGNRISIVGRRHKPITEDTVKNLHVLAETLLSCNSDYKLVVSVDQGYVYTDDLSLLDRVDQLPFLQYKDYSRAKVDRPANTIRLKNPRHKFRSYFRLVKLTNDQKQQLVKFLKNQQASIRTSPALTHWFDISFTRTQDYFFVDYDSELWLTMLALVHPGIVRKTMHIIPAK